MYVVLYARVVDDKDGMGTLMTGVHFGGFSPNKEDAERIAKLCVDETQGGMVIPKIVRIRSTLNDTVQDVVRVYDRMAERMYEVEQALNRR